MCPFPNDFSMTVARRAMTLLAVSSGNVTGLLKNEIIGAKITVVQIPYPNATFTGDDQHVITA